MMTLASNAAESLAPAPTDANSPLRSPSVGAAIGSMQAKEAPRGEKTWRYG